MEIQEGCTQKNPSRSTLPPVRRSPSSVPLRGQNFLHPFGPTPTPQPSAAPSPPARLPEKVFNTTTSKSRHTICFTGNPTALAAACGFRLAFETGNPSPPLPSPTPIPIRFKSREGTSQYRRHLHRQRQSSRPPPLLGRVHCSIGMENNSMSRTRGLNRCQGKPIFKRRRTSLQFEDLPEDMLCTILSELPLKEVVRTSILSRKWRHLWTNCRKLRFDGVTMCGDNTCGSEQYTRKFIDNVNAVLQQHHGKEVEELEVIFEFESMLVNHLNNWVGFAVSSRTKSLAFDLVPAEFRGRRDRYIFPFELLDNDSIRRLQRIQLSFVSFKPPPQFSGFPNLRKLDLHLLYITRKDLENMLSNCFNLEWLSIVRCNLDGGLKVASPLPRLLYLHVVGCRITKIEFNAMKLTTFVYKGLQIPFDLGQALELKDADFYVFGSVTL